MNINDSNTTPRHIVLVIDDTLDMDLQRQGLLTPTNGMATLLSTDGNPLLLHCTSLDEAEMTLAVMAEDFRNHAPNAVAPEQVSVISDYKLVGAQHETLWGPDILTRIAARADYRPGNLFLMSKSGFRGEDQPTLDAIGAQYFHTNEMMYAAAHRTGREDLMRLYSEMTKTSSFREWMNTTFGTELGTGVYAPSTILAAEYGRVPVAEVIRRIEDEKLPHHAGMQLLDTHSVQAAFRSRVNAPDDTLRATIAHGIAGPSVAGRLAFTEADIARIREETPDAPIVLVLDHDYSPKDHSLLEKASAVMLLERGTQHIPVWVEHANIPALFANKTDDVDFTRTGNTLMHHEGVGAATPFAQAGEWLSVDGSTREIFVGKQPIIPPQPEVIAAAKKLAEYGTMHANRSWHHVRADGAVEDHTGVGVMANASTLEEVQLAKRTPGVVGIGLLRTEPMMRSEERRNLVLEALCTTGLRHISVLNKLRDAHIDDLTPILAEEDPNFPIHVRLFDFAPEEYFPDPNDDNTIADIAHTIDVEPEALKALCQRVRSENLRGARLMYAFPKLAEAQCEAIMLAKQAALGLSEIEPPKPHIAHILVPAVTDASQLRFIHAYAGKARYHGDIRRQMQFEIGSMIETRELAPTSSEDTERMDALRNVVGFAKFLCLGTNDLTEAVTNIPRGDIEAVLEWNARTRNPQNPYQELVPEVQQVVGHVMDCVHELHPTTPAKAPYPVIVCGAQASHRASVAFAQAQCLPAISVPATEPSLMHAQVETGRIALLETIASRSKLDEVLLGKIGTKEPTAAPNLQLPEGVKIINDEVFEESFPSANCVFVFIEDDREQGLEYEFNLKTTHPLVMASSVADGLKTAEALRAMGKHVHIITDDNVAEHADRSTSQERDAMNALLQRGSGRGALRVGSALAQAVAAGRVPSVGVEDITVVSISLWHQQPEGVKDLSKAMNYLPQLSKHLDDVAAMHAERMQPNAQPISETPAAAPSREGLTIALPPGAECREPHLLETHNYAFVCVDDADSVRNGIFATIAEGMPLVTCEDVNNGLHTITALHRAGKRVFLYTDKLVQLGAGDEWGFHPVTSNWKENSSGLSLMRSIAAGEVEGVHADDVCAMSAGNAQGVPDGMQFMPKRRQMFDTLPIDLKEKAASMQAHLGTITFPECVHVPSPEAVQQCPKAYVILEDSEHIQASYSLLYKGLPFVGCEDINSALHAIAALRAAGKEVFLYADMEVNFDTHDLPTHPSAGELNWMSNGRDLIKAVAAGAIRGIDAGHTFALTSGNTHGLPESIRVIVKWDDGHITVREHMREGMAGALSQPETPTTPLPKSAVSLSPKVLRHAAKAFVIVEDDEEQRGYFQRHLDGYPVVIVGNVNDALHTLDALHAMGKQVHVFCDAGVERGGTDTQQHPQLRMIADEKHVPPGVGFASYLGDGEHPQLAAKDITIMSAAIRPYPLPEGVKQWSKHGLNILVDNMEGAMDRMQAEAMRNRGNEKQRGSGI